MPCLLALGLSSIPLATDAIQSAWAVRDNTPAVHVITGILALMDLSTGKGMIKTDLGKPIFFHISRPDQFSRLSIGDRVTIQLDDEGRSLKVIEALPSEVHEPPPAPK
jgi:cold shock CspA family protein